jgi:ABC-2 type transport system permease protein
MQILYLVPPALLLWRDMGANTQVHVILAPVLVMAFGQLAGGLAWLAISGEDAPDLVATAPLPRRAIMRAKNEAVLMAIATVALPLVGGVAIVSIGGAIATAAGIAVAAVSAIAIQLWFRVTATRSQFRRRQTASKTSTFAEAFSSIFWGRRDRICGSRIAIRAAVRGAGSDHAGDRLRDQPARLKAKTI